MFEYTNNTQNVTPEMLTGFFEGWANKPSPAAHKRILDGSYCVWMAIDVETNMVVGFVNAVSDGVMAAYIPLLEVLPEYQNRGIGKTLVSKLLASLKHLYMIDVLCDEDVLGYYTKLGMVAATGAIARNYDRQSCG